jgi:HK97 gp10 family phage protein
MRITGGNLWWNGDAAKKDMGSKIDAKMIQLGKEAVEAARNYVAVDTGELQNSIGFTYRQSDKTITLHADTHYAFFQEFGTRFMMPHPFLRPAILKVFPVKVNTAIQFSAIRSRKTSIASPKANADVVSRGNKMNAAIGRQFSVFTGRRAPRVEFMGRTAKSTPDAVGKYGHGTARIGNVSWNKILGRK